MRYKDKEYYAYLLVGMIKTSAMRRGEDAFELSDFNLTKLKLTDASIASLSLKSIKEILLFIELTINKYYATYEHTPNYDEIRRYLMPQSLFL